MIFLILNILVSFAILTFFKLFDRLSIHKNFAIVVSYFVAFAASLISYKGKIELSDLISNGYLKLGIITGITFYIGFQLFATSTQKIGLAITSVSGNISVVLPVVFAMVVFGESSGALKIGGILVALISFYFIFKPERNQSIEKHKIIFPALLFVVTGTNAILLKIGQQNGSADSKLLLMAIIFLFAFFTGLIHLLASKSKPSITPKNIGGALLLGLLNFTSTTLLFKALSIFEASVFFPVYNSGYIAISALGGYLFFKEKLKPVNIFGIFMAMVAIIIITSF